MIEKLEKFAVLLIGLTLVLNYISKSFFYIDSALIFLLTVIIIYKKEILFKNFFRYKIPFLLICSYSILYLINLFNETVTYKSNITIILHLLLLYALYYYFILSKLRHENFNFVIKVLFVSISILSIILLIGYLSSIDILYSIKKLKYVRFTPGTYHSSQTFLTVGIGLLLFYTQKNNTFLNKLLLVGIISATFIVEGKTAIITLLLGMFIYFGTYTILTKKLTIIKLIASTSLLVVLFSIMLYIRSGNDANLDLNNFTSGRLQGWIIYFHLILEENTFFGFGIQGGSNLLKEGIIAFKHPHNIFVEALFTTGVIGFLILLCLWMIYFKNVFLIKIEADIKALMITTFFTVLIASQGFWSIWSKNHLIPILIVISLSFFAKEKSND